MPKKATKKEIQEIKSLFLKHYKNAKTELIYKNDYELLIAVMLSAQCTDKRFNLVTPVRKDATRPSLTRMRFICR